MNFIEQKRLILEYHHELISSEPGKIGEIIDQMVTEEYVWTGSHPFNELNSESLVHKFWGPLKKALPVMEIRHDVCMAGEFLEKSWVCTMGYIYGNFKNDWLSIPRTNKPLFIRFCEFNRFEGDRIAETYVLHDMSSVLHQAGIRIFPESTGADILVPGPAAGDGVLLGDSDLDETKTSLQLVESMIFEGLGGFHGVDMPEELHAVHWDKNMLWYGPAGIGTTFGIDGFKHGHQIPFRKALSDRNGGNHVCRIADGKYIASTGWPSYRATLSGGGWLGLPASGQKVGMRVVDVWKREGEHLKENWVFIDFLDMLKHLGYDVLGRLDEMNEPF